MSDVEVLLTLAGAVITVWLSLLVAALLWLGRRTAGRVRHEIGVVSTRRATPERAGQSWRV